jgi:hypothetical protein
MSIRILRDFRSQDGAHCYSKHPGCSKRQRQVYVSVQSGFVQADLYKHIWITTYAATTVHPARQVAPHAKHLGHFQTLIPQT